MKMKTKRKFDRVQTADGVSGTMLGLAIIEHAASKWRKFGHWGTLRTKRRMRNRKFKARGKNKAQYHLQSPPFDELFGYKSPRRELLAFFRSKWCKYLCETCGVNMQYMAYKLKIPGLEEE